MADPIGLFLEWYGQLRGATAGAVTLATVDDAGMPWARMVLLKGVDERGFTFFTNQGSPKARQLDANPRAALCFYWPDPGRQVRVQGSVERVSDAESDAYFATRPRASQIGAWASRQSEPLSSREELDARTSEMEVRFGGGEVPRPEFWGGYRLLAERLEFWEERLHRLHERVLYERDGAAWKARRLYP